MVSALTGRLFSSGEYSCAGNDGGAALKRKSEAVDVSSTSRSSGYAADVDQVGKALPPFYVNLQAKPEETKSMVNDGKLNTEIRADGRITAVSSKRQKIVEKDYLAQNALAEIARGGLAVPKMQLKCPRLLPPLCGIDMSRVTLIKSSEYPLQFSDQKTANPEKEICVQSIVSLAEACRDFYQIPCDHKSSERSDDQSSTSSVTDSGETDAGSGNSDDDDEVTRGKKSAFMTMCDALSLCKQPRIVVLSTYPFSIVHANAAYLQTTGLSSMRLLGQPLQDFVIEKRWVTALNNGSDSAFDVKQMNRQVVKMRTGSQKGPPLQCLIMASPIGMAHDRVTHFALGLEPVNLKAQTPDLEEPFTPAMTISG